METLDTDKYKLMAISKIVLESYTIYDITFEPMSKSKAENLSIFLKAGISEAFYWEAPDTMSTKMYRVKKGVNVLGIKEDGDPQNEWSWKVACSLYRL